jgi:hypothetical protein
MLEDGDFCPKHKIYTLKTSRDLYLLETSQIFHSPPSNANPTPPHKSQKWLPTIASL